MKTSWMIAGALLVACGGDRVESAPAGAVRAVAPAPEVRADGTSATQHAEGAPADRDLLLTDADRLLDRVREPRLRGLVVNIWASWCGSCKEEIPLLLGLRKSFAAEGIEFVFVTADDAKDFPQAVSLMRSWEGPLPVLGVSETGFKAFKRALNPEWRGAIPATFLFDSTRKLRHFWEGPIVEQEITPVLQGLLAGQNIDGVTRTAAAPRP